MCGRFSQREQSDIYAALLNWTAVTEDNDRYLYNVPPGSRPLVMHRLNDGKQHMERVYWGYEPTWGTKGPAGNARLDKLQANAGFWRETLQRRMIVPVDGWYEWTGPKGNKQPWFIGAGDGYPILLAAVSGWEAGVKTDGHTGFAIVTDAAADELKEIHLRRPVVLTPDRAQAWLDPDLHKDQAIELLSTARPESAFQWWPVTREMGDSKYQQPDASRPIHA